MRTPNAQWYLLLNRGRLLLLRELRQHDGHQGQLPCDAILRCHSIMPSLVHMLDVCVLVRLPVAVFSLAFRKSMPMPWSGCVLPMTPREQATSMLAFGCVPTYVSGSIISISPVKPCRRRRHFSPQMRVNRFVFLNLPILQPREPSRRNGFASVPFTCGLRHPAS